ncbi:MAG: tetratricopeptide repeat protein, partial [Bacteriovoracaceae bacterium]
MWEILTIIILAGIVFFFSRKNKLKDQHGTTEIPPIIVKEDKKSEGEEEEKSIERLLSDAHTHFEQKSYQEAEKIAIEVVKRDHKNSSAYFILGNVFFEDKNFDDAINSFKKSIEYDPANDLTLNNL